MNIYRTRFALACPNNGRLIDYRLEIRTIRVVMVEDIQAAIATASEAGKPYHETVADQLHEALGGVQTIVAFHHGVEIETVRGL